MSRPDGKPLCSCGIHTLSFPSLSLERKWESSENEKWKKLENGSLAYFIYCTDCHKRKCPEDVRTQGPWCTPAEPFWARWKQESKGVCKLLSGDFYLTKPCPELSLPSRVPRAAVTNTSRDASRSPPGRVGVASVGFRGWQNEFGVDFACELLSRRGLECHGFALGFACARRCYCCGFAMDFLCCFGPAKVAWIRRGFSMDFFVLGLLRWRGLGVDF